MNRLFRSLCVAVGALAFCAAPALACVNVGVYQDKPAKTLPALQKKAGKNVKTVSTYLTVGHALDPKLVTLVRKRGVKLLISWLPDAGKDSPKAPGYRLSAIDRQVRQRPEGARKADQSAAARSHRPSHARSQHALVRLVGHRQRQPARRLRQGVEARPQGAPRSGGQEGRAALERVCAQRPGRQEQRAEGVFPGRQAGRPGRRRRLQLRQRPGPDLDGSRRSLRAGLRDD